MTIEAIARPEGKSTEYQFFRNAETGHRFKVKVFPTSAAPVSRVAGQAANTQFGVCITTSLIDDDDRAVSEDGLPVVDSYSRTFTEVAIAEPGFSVQATVAQIVKDRIEALEARYAALASLLDIQSAWSAEPMDLKGSEQ